jgi:hypothetical protein
MKKLTLIFAAITFVIGFAVISCTKESTTTPPELTIATDATVVDNSVADIAATIDAYEGVNTAYFADPTLKAASVDPIPTNLAAYACATVTATKTPTIVATAVVGAVVNFTINFGTTGCVSADKKVRTGTITSVYTWVKATASAPGGWTRVSTINLTIDGVKHVGAQTITWGVTGTNNHAYLTEATTVTVTPLTGDAKTWTSTRTRELMEGNGGVNPIKLWKITGSSTFTNGTVTSTYTIVNPLFRMSTCKGFVAGSVTTVSTAGVSTTIDYGPYTTNAALLAAPCKDGYTITGAADKNGKGAFSRFIKFGK